MDYPKPPLGQSNKHNKQLSLELDKNLAQRVVNNTGIRKLPVNKEESDTKRSYHINNISACDTEENNHINEINPVTLADKDWTDEYKLYKLLEA